MAANQYCQFCGSRLLPQPAERAVRSFCQQCHAIVYQNPVPATCAVVVDAEDRILLIKRGIAPKRGMWSLPGGFMAMAESPEQAALRDLSEETGLVGGIDLLLGVISVPDKRFGTIVMIGYLIKSFGGDLAPGDDAAEAAFFSRDTLPSVAFTSHQAFIRIYYSAYASHR